MPGAFPPLPGHGREVAMIWAGLAPESSKAIRGKSWDDEHIHQSSSGCAGCISEAGSKNTWISNIATPGWLLYMDNLQGFVWQLRKNFDWFNVRMPRYCKTARPTNADTTCRYLSNASILTACLSPTKHVICCRAVRHLQSRVLTPLAKVCNEHVIYEALRPDMIWIYNLHNLAAHIYSLWASMGYLEMVSTYSQGRLNFYFPSSITLPMKPAWTAVICFQWHARSKKLKVQENLHQNLGPRGSEPRWRGKGLRAARFQQPGLSNNLIDRPFNLFEIDFVEETVIGKPWKPIHNAQQCLIQTWKLNPRRNCYTLTQSNSCAPRSRLKILNFNT